MKKRRARIRVALSKSIDRERHRSIISAIHSTAIDSPLVIDFGSEPLREAFRIWWHPYDMGTEFDELCGKGTFKVFKRGKSRGIQRVSPATVRSGASIEWAFDEHHRRRRA